MNVYDQAHSLAAAIKASEEFKQYEEKKQVIDANPQIRDAINDFMKRQMEMQIYAAIILLVISILCPPS